MIDILFGVVENLFPAAVFLTLTLVQLAGLALFVVWIIVVVNAATASASCFPS